jgi:hypothetical protein
MKEETSSVERLQAEAEKPCLQMVRLPINPSEPPDQILAAIPELEHPDLQHPDLDYQTTPFWQKLPQPAPATVDLDRATRPSVRSRSLAGLLVPGRIALKKLLQGPVSFQTAGRDSRLWTSFAMAGVSALLVLGLISSVRRHATPALPGQVLHASSPSKASLPQPASSASQESASRTESVRSPTPGAIASPQRSAAQRVAKPKPRRAQDDDYVAPDTFVSYDNRRSGSR